MTALAGYYEGPLRAWLVAHGIEVDSRWREEVAQRGLDLRPWKRARVLPRIRAAIALLRSLAPASVLDVGSGRGAFLWPAHEALQATHFTACELPGHAAERLVAVQRGGLPRFAAAPGDACSLHFADRAFPWATALEVLEHLPEPLLAARELARVTGDGAIVTVPRLPDDNPEHLRCFDAPSLRQLLAAAGFARVRVDVVDDCWLATAWR